MRYENSYAKAFPFGKLIDGMLDPRMIEDTVQLIWEVLRKERRIAIIINNRAGGNAPLIAQLIAKNFQSAWKLTNPNNTHNFVVYVD
jgi:hypothetical protein